MPIRRSESALLSVDTGATTRVMPWPEIPAHITPLVDAVAGYLHQQVFGGQKPHTVAQERAIPQYAEQALALMLKTNPSEVMLARDIEASPDLRQQVIAWITVRTSGLWPLSLLAYADGIEEISCFRHDRWLIRSGGLRTYLAEGCPFADDGTLLTLLREVINWPDVTGTRALDAVNPIASVNVGPLMRLSVTIPPVLSTGAGLQASMRFQGRTNVRSLEDMVRVGTMSANIADLLRACVQARVSLLISGGMFAGKTSLLRILCGLIPRHEVVVCLEDGAELHLEADRGDGEPWVANCQAMTTLPAVVTGTEAGITIAALVKASLRMGSERMILGEARGAEMADVCTAATTGQSGTMATIHAERADLAPIRGKRCIMLAPEYRGQDQMADDLIHEAFELIVHLSRSVDGARRITGIVALQEASDLVVLYERRHGVFQRIENFGAMPRRLQTKLEPLLHGALPEP
ncbi:MAG TPA: ATPase, T2SS/T4P/T4SS family [Candidatus Dormibacteraeota bacterium]|nr:ATPase, T2SS/T4P/T4SS family [Candidatus Dormibacteraeota bacterium]